MQYNNSQILQIVYEFIQSWRILKPENIQIKRLTGITNNIFKISHRNSVINPTHIIFRIFGNVPENKLINRDNQNKILESLNSICGPKIYGYTTRVRIEEYIDSITMNREMMLDEQIFKKVAFKLHKLHEIEIRFLKKQSVINEFIEQNSSYLNQFVQKIQSNIFTQDQHVILKKIQFWINSEKQFLRNAINTFSTSLVFSHNDTLANNILIKPDQSIEIIDYQYSGYNFESFDIANYFNESLVNYDFQEPPYFEWNVKIPDQNKVKKFIQYYALASSINQKQYEEILSSEQKKKQYIEKNKINIKIEQIQRQYPYCLMICNYFWSVWAVWVSKNPNINFDYIKYAQKRMKQYYYVKQYFNLK